jgi:G:T-mismatch repair DNA endonuclease (very short patch repair protein)
LIWECETRNRVRLAALAAQIKRLVNYADGK